VRMLPVQLDFTTRDDALNAQHIPVSGLSGRTTLTPGWARFAGKARQSP